jgi:hypothetical protein
MMYYINIRLDGGLLESQYTDSAHLETTELSQTLAKRSVTSMCNTWRNNECDQSKPSTYNIQFNV